MLFFVNKIILNKFDSLTCGGSQNHGERTSLGFRRKLLFCNFNKTQKNPQPIQKVGNRKSLNFSYIMKVSIDCVSFFCSCCL